MVSGEQAVILVVEDEEQLRLLVAETLAGSGYTVLQARDATEALALLAERHVDLLFTDIVIPGMSGFLLAQAARRKQPDLRVLFTSGFADDAEGREAIRQARLLRKPYRLHQLLDEVANALAQPGTVGLLIPLSGGRGFF